MNTPKSKITLAMYGNKRQKVNLDKLHEFMSLLHDNSNKVTVKVDRRYHTFIGQNAFVPYHWFEPMDSYEGAADLVLSVGGDGTFLSTANRVGAFETPIMGINTGHLGYMAAAEISQASDIVNDILSGNYKVEPRTLIMVEGAHGLDPRNRYALNEVAILKLDTASMITVQTRLDGMELANYRADGLIVSTPTGSTGYNLSVGGPIVDPTAKNWILAPVAPHSLNMRPLVVSDSSQISLSVVTRAEHFLLSIDGRSTSQPLGTELKLSMAPHKVMVANRHGHNFIETIRQKLSWGVD